jgi:hypothetical protein
MLANEYLANLLYIDDHAELLNDTAMYDDAAVSAGGYGLVLPGDI